MPAEQNNLDQMDPGTLLRVIAKVHLLTGITIGEQKQSMLQGRLRKRMRTLQITSYEEYMNHLDVNVDERQEFINLMTTNETSFFRTPRIWNYFQESFLPNWYGLNTKKILKIWSAASSTGSEAYSIAISCLEFKMMHPDFEFKILASDISTEVVGEANRGVYLEKPIENFRKNNPNLFTKYIQKNDDGDFQVSNELRKYVTFTTHNLFSTRNELYDIVFLRNVLIYFSQIDQEKVLKNISKSLTKEGEIIIGESESLSNLDTPFIFKDACIYNFKKEG